MGLAGARQQPARFGAQNHSVQTRLPYVNPNPQMVSCRYNPILISDFHLKYFILHFVMLQLDYICHEVSGSNYCHNYFLLGNCWTDGSACVC